jgi:hypothetical protein
MVNWRVWLRCKAWSFKTWWSSLFRAERETGLENFEPRPGGGWDAPAGMTKEQFEAGHPNVKMTAVGSEQVLAPLNPALEWKEPIFGAATIANESDRTITLRNDLLFVVLKPGQRHTISEAILKAGYDRQARTKTTEAWDPLNTLQDLIAEYERSQDPVVRYNWNKAALIECSQLKAFRVRGGS